MLNRHACGQCRRHFGSSSLVSSENASFCPIRYQYGRQVQVPVPFPYKLATAPRGSHSQRRPPRCVIMQNCLPVCGSKTWWKPETVLQSSSINELWFIRLIELPLCTGAPRTFISGCSSRGTWRPHAAGTWFRTLSTNCWTRGNLQ